MASAAILIIWLQLGLTEAFLPDLSLSLTGLQQPSLHRPPRRFRRSTPSSASAINPVVDDETTPAAEEQTKITHDWEEQFERLLSFREEYGHPNFPRNASTELNEEYPMLARFCQDHRRQCHMHNWDRLNGRETTTLPGFDRNIRHDRLEQIGFEFNALKAKWYDRYHELCQYRNLHGDVRVTKTENRQLFKWISTQRMRRNGTKTSTKLSDTQIELLDNIGFEWDSQLYDTMWMAKYNELVAFRNQHGHLLLQQSDSPQLHQWMSHQRSRRAGKSWCAPLSEQQMKLLDDIAFQWEPVLYDSKWRAKYNELVQFQKKHGHCQPSLSNYKILFEWSKMQRKKRDEGLLSTQQIELLDKIDFSWKSNRLQWATMFDELVEYCNHCDHLHVDQDDDAELCEWMAWQRKRYHGIIEKPAMTDNQIELLEEVNFCWSMDRSERMWHDKYTEAAEFYKEHGNVMVNEKENPSLYNWIATQEKRYKGMKGQTPLSEEELELLEHIDFPFFDNQPRVTWNASYAALVKYQEDHDGRLPNHKDDPILDRWTRQQRKRLRCSFGYAPLSEEQKASLESIEFPFLPVGKNLRAWYQHYDELVEFWKQHGHFVVDRADNIRLVQWITKQRLRYNSSIQTVTSDRLLTKSETYLLGRIGFPWTSERYEVEWQSKYNELVKFWEKHGHMEVKEVENKSLYNWMRYQRTRYRGERYTDLLDHQIELLEKIGFQWYSRDGTI